MGKLKYDKDLLDYVEDKHPVGYHILRVLKFLAYTLALVLLYYLIFTLFFSSDEERRMISESRLIEERYDELSAQTQLLESAVAELSQKDENIYRELFNTDFPEFTFSDSASLDYTSDMVYSAAVISHTHQKIDRLSREFDACGELISQIQAKLEGVDKDSLARIPCVMPVADFPLDNVGASVGRKMHPFYKQVVYHGGLDLVTPVGVEVRATADGRVRSVERAQKLQGTRIVIDHGNGYETVYAHLSDLLVRSGQRVSRGDVIGRTGNSGTSFAPHLHYEVILNGVQLDPLNYFNGELDAEHFGELLIYAVNTGQSLD